MENRITITYEILYDILRKEKSKGELQKLDNNFISDVIAYLKEKELMYQEAVQKKELFSDAEAENLRKQVGNIKKILRELYEKREKKIIETSLNKSRTRSRMIDASAMMPKEKEFFENLVLLFDKYRNEILFNVVDGKPSSLASKSKTSVADGQSVNAADGVVLMANEGTTNKKTKAPAEASQGTVEDIDNVTNEPAPKATKLLKFLQQVPQFLGPELEIYGPFDPGAKAYLSTEIADILIGDGKAVEIEE